MAASKKLQRLRDKRLMNVPYLLARAEKRLPLFDGASRSANEEAAYRGPKKVYHVCIDNLSTSAMENRGANDIALRAWEDGESI